MGKLRTLAELHADAVRAKGRHEAVRAYADEHGVTLAEARERLVDVALGHLAARVRAGRKTHEGIDASTRTVNARKLARQRWDKKP